MCTDTHALTFEGPGEWDGSVTYAKRFLLQRVIYYVIADYNTQHGRGQHQTCLYGSCPENTRSPLHTDTMQLKRVLK